MRSNIINRLLLKLEKQITLRSKQRLKESFDGYSLMRSSARDASETKRLIQNYNSMAKEFNQLGRTMAFLFLRKMEQFQTQPQDDFMGAVDEWLRLRYLNKSPNVFRSINTKLHFIEKRMEKLSNGKDGIETLRDVIIKLRKA